MNKIYKLAYDGQSEKAKQCINQTCKHFQFSFIKPLIKRGGLLDILHYETSKQMLNNFSKNMNNAVKNGDIYLDFYKDRIKCYKYIIKLYEKMMVNHH